MMFKLFIIVFPIIGAVIGHDTYTGTCPKFQGMSGFDWNKVFDTDICLTFIANQFLIVSVKSHLRIISS